MEQVSIMEGKKIYSSTTKREKRRVEVSKIRDRVCEWGVFLFTVVSALLIVFIFIFIFSKAWGVIKFNGLGFIFNTGFDKHIDTAFNASADNPHWEFGAFALLIGTLTTTLGALIISVPLGVGTAIVITELAPKPVKSFLQSVVRLLASIPSVIFALIGLLVIIQFIKKVFINSDMQIKYIKEFNLSGNSMLAGIIVLSIMILPIIIALSVDAINAVPKTYKEAALALGLSKWRTIIKVIIPAAKSGILAGIVLGTGRALGEAIALSMVSGSRGYLPNPSHGGVFFLTPVLTLASAIVNKAETISVSSIESALFGCGVILLITSTSLSLFTKVIERAIRRREGLE